MLGLRFASLLTIGAAQPTVVSRGTLIQRRPFELNDGASFFNIGQTTASAFVSSNAEVRSMKCATGGSPRATCSKNRIGLTGPGNITDILGSAAASAWLYSRRKRSGRELAQSSGVLPVIASTACRRMVARACTATGLLASHHIWPKQACVKRKRIRLKL